LELPLFVGIINQIKSFVSYVLFPTKNDVPDGEKSAWWIPNAVKVLALTSSFITVYHSAQAVLTS